MSNAKLSLNWDQHIQNQLITYGYDQDFLKGFVSNITPNLAAYGLSEKTQIMVKSYQDHFKIPTVS